MRSRRLHRWLVVPAVVVIALLAATPAAVAHVDLAGSSPEDGATIEGPLESIELQFTVDSEPAGDGIRLLSDPDTEVPAEVTRVDGLTMVITPETPLGDGAYGVAWTMKSGDAHPRSGAVTFTVTEPVLAGAAPDQEPTEAAPAAESEQPAPSPEPDPALIAALTVGSDTGFADWLGRLARAGGLLGALIGVGALVFGLRIPSSESSEARRAAYWARRGGALVVLAVPIEIIAQAILNNGGSLADGLRIGAMASALGGSSGWAMAFKAVGGIGMLRGAALDTISTTRLNTRPAGRSIGPAGTPTAVMTKSSHVLDPAASLGAIGGSALVILSFAFDGHTATESPALLVKTGAVVHAAAGAVWVGGVAMLAATLARRRAAGVPLRAGPLAIRFSSIATPALVAVGLAGSILAWSILDAFGELFSTTWGRTLLVKLAAVGTAAAIGGYNHFVLLPRLEAGEDEATSDLLRRTSLTEVAILVGVVVTTAVLVGSVS